MVGKRKYVVRTTFSGIIVIHLHHKSINVPIAEIQAFLMDYT
jgi:hypothetical protein